MICVSCQNTDNEHYTYPAKDGTRVYFTKCKKCHNPTRLKKPIGFQKLSKETQDRIKLAVSDRKNKISDIAMEEGITYENLRRWVAKGL